MRMPYIHFCFLVFLLLESHSFATASDHVNNKSKFEEEKLLSSNIAIQGIVYCKSGSKLIPLKGALTRITCEAVDEYGFETKALSFLSKETDAKGYFLATLYGTEVAEKREVKECRAFLDASPLDNCSYPTDFNKGISGAMLHSYSFLHDKKMKLYTVGPFLFTSPPQSISNGY